MDIRRETPADAEQIRALVTEAFETAPESEGTEASIVDRLRSAGALVVSLVAEDGGEVVGYIAFSPVTVDGVHAGWFGLGPVAVRPDKQRTGIGGALIASGLEQLKEFNARGCVVVGDPAYYARFGFRSDPRLHYGEIPPEYVQGLGFSDDWPTGELGYHEAFGAG